MIRPLREAAFCIGFCLLAAGVHALPVRDVREATLDTLARHEPATFPPQGIELKLSTPAPADVDPWHLRTGVPIPFGALRTDDGVALYRDDRRVDVQATPVATWGPPGSPFADHVKWLRLDFVDALRAGEQPTWRLKRETGADASTNKPVGMPAGFDVTPYIVDGDGRTFYARDPQFTVEQQGPLAAVLRAEGWFVNPDVEIDAPQGEPEPRPSGGFCRYVTRLYVAAGCPDVRVQHTVIFTEDSSKTTYRDIGLALPATGPATYGGVDGEHTGHTWLLQDHFDHYVVRRGDETIAEGGKAPGWVRAGSTAVAVRDFWQNYPGELEVTGDEMRIHFWPAHGSPRKDQPPQLNDKNAWRLPWVHSGEKLDFNSPAALRDEKTYPGQHSGGYVDLMYNSNAIGVAKTHDLLISFDADASFADRAANFQHNPHALTDPQHIAATEVFGRIPAADFNKRPLTERRYLGSAHWIVRTKDNFGSFGMFNYGDMQTSLDINSRGEVRPVYRRLWNGSEYNYPHVAWQLYWRSGDHTVGQHARRNGRHVMDVDTCHWTNAHFSSRDTQPSYHQRKRVGGMGDLRALHWHAGDLTSFFAAVDYMLYDYYLTGNRRAWDVAKEHGYYAAEGPFKDVGRGPSGVADVLVEFYKATWDPAVGEALRKQVQEIIDQPIEAHRGKLDWRPWINRYMDLTGDPAVREFLIDWVEHNAGLATTAAAWHATGDEKYAVRCARTLFLNALQTVVRDDEYDGLYGRRLKGWSNELTAGLLAMTPASHVTLNLRDFQPPDQWPYFTNWGLSTPLVGRESASDYFGGAYPWYDETENDPRFRMTAWVHHDGSPKRLWLGVQNTHAQPGSDVRLFAPDGALRNHVHLEHFDRVIRGTSNGKAVARKLLWPRRVPEYNATTGDTVTIEGKTYPIEKNRTYLAERPLESVEDLYALCSEPVDLGPNDPRGFYRVEYTGLFFTPVPLLPPGGKVWLEVGEASTMYVRDSMQYFFVPQDVERFTLGFLPAGIDTWALGHLHFAAGAVLDPDCNVVEPISCALEREPQLIEVDVKPEHRGRVWAIAGSNFSIVRMDGVPNFISPSFDTVASEPHAPVVNAP